MNEQRERAVQRTDEARAFHRYLDLLLIESLLIPYSFHDCPKKPYVPRKYVRGSYPTIPNRAHRRRLK